MWCLSQSWLVDNVLVGWNPSKIPSLHGMNAVVTGANSGIGWSVFDQADHWGATASSVMNWMSIFDSDCHRLLKAPVLRCDPLVRTCTCTCTAGTSPASWLRMVPR
jgi:hypothetical protein